VELIRSLLPKIAENYAIYINLQKSIILYTTKSQNAIVFWFLVKKKYMMIRMHKRLVVIPKMVRVSTLVHVFQVSVGKLNTITPVSFVSYFEMTLRAKQDAIAEKVRAAVFSWFPVMWLPTPVSAFGSVASAEPFTTSSTLPPLSFPSLLFSVGRKSHQSVSRNAVKWVKNGDMWVLLHNGKSYNIAIMYFPPSSFSGRARGEYRVFKGSRIIGFARTLEAAKQRAERIKVTGRVFK
jgi:hypothetical protein